MDETEEEIDTRRRPRPEEPRLLLLVERVLLLPLGADDLVGRWRLFLSLLEACCLVLRVLLPTGILESSNPSNPARVEQKVYN